MKKLFLSLLVSFTLLSTIQSQVEKSIDQLFNRSWNKTVTEPSTTYTFIFKNDSTCTFINPANQMSIRAKIKLEGDLITFPAEGCSTEGTYKFSIAKNRLTFQTENDLCNDRKNAVEGIWITDETSNSIESEVLSPRKIYMDIAHGQRFWNDPAHMNGQDQNWIDRVKYMTDQFVKTASSVNAKLLYLRNKVKPEDLSDCDLLFIHIPSIQYTPGEVKAITQYLDTGGTLFLVMDEDYWSSLENTNVNEIIRPYEIEFGSQNSDTTLGGITKANLITEKSLKITYYGGRIINGGTPFCFSSAKENYPFGVYTKVENGGKIIVMGDGMTSLYMTSWKGVNDFQCSEFMHDTVNWLLSKE